MSQIGEEVESPEVSTGKVSTVKKDSNPPTKMKTKLQELKAEVEALKTEVKSRPGTNTQPDTRPGRQESGNQLELWKGLGKTGNETPTIQMPVLP